MPPRLVQNEESWLAFTDLVFVDPVGTGFSRVIDDEKKDGAARTTRRRATRPTRRSTSGYKRDLESLCEFMGRWLSSHGRWGSPVFIAGESYGGYRVGRLVRHAPGERRDRAQRGDPDLARARDRDAGPERLRRPRVGRPATDDGRRGRRITDARAPFAPGTPLDDVLREAESVRHRRLHGVPDPRRLDAPRTSATASSPALADLIGLPADMVARAEGRITIRMFSRELLRDQRKVLGLYDATITVTDPFPDRDSFAGPDPTLSGISPAYTMAINRQLRSEIGVETDREYTLLSYEVNEAWKNDARAALLHAARSAPPTTFATACRSTRT